MIFSDEVLAAYADDELDQKTRADVEAAMAADPDIARRIEQHRALRKRLRSAFDSVLEEPVPQHLIDLARNAQVSSSAPKKGPLQVLPRRASRPGFAEWAALAASLLIGIIAGLAFRTGSPGIITARGGHLMASGLLADALTSQLASRQQVSQPVQIGVSFRSKSGEYCRTFSTRSPATAGLACHAQDGWRLRVLSERKEHEVAAGVYRQAESAVPAAVVSTVSEEISGEPLDARAEAAARSRDWRP